jgi:alkylated DNA repair dioxygenase AlkB
MAAAEAHTQLACAMTLTFGECAENHVGNQQLGHIADAGFTEAELAAAREMLVARGCVADLVELGDGASVLVLRGGLGALGLDADAMYREHDRLDVDTKALMYKRVVNKRARHNLCYDDVAQVAEYASGKGTVVAFAAVPMLNALRTALPHALGLGAKAADLKCELNKYYDPSTCGIGFHGDSERKRVVAVRLGVPIPLVFGWWHRTKPVGEKIVVDLQHGDMYVMSEKATGFDWKRSSIRTLRHAAGCEKFTGVAVDLPAAAARVRGLKRAGASATGVACAVAKQLENTGGETAARLLALLQTLDAARIDVDALAKSSVGRLVKPLRKHSDTQVASLASSLVAKWKTIAKEAGVVSKKAKVSGVLEVGGQLPPTA